MAVLAAGLVWPAPAAGGAEATPAPEPTPAVGGEATPAPGTVDDGGAVGGLAPDIIVVMVDDLGYISDERVLRRLPHIRQLWLDEGIRFTRMYDETPLCCPARSSFLTGLHTWRHGVTKNNGNLLDPSRTIAVALQDAGYHTFMAGNYLNKVRGSKVPPGWDRTLIKRDSVPPRFWRNGRSITYRRAFVDDVTRQVAVNWVRTSPADQPLFAWVAPVAPHVCEFRRHQCYVPMVVRRDRDARECRGLPDLRPPSYTTTTNPLEARPMPDWPNGWNMRRICRALVVVDRMVGQLAEAQARRDRPAVFVFMSDNGMSWGQKGFTFKRTPPAGRLPFYMAGAGIAPGTTDALLSIIDVAPTIAELAGIDLAAVDGDSFGLLLRGEPFEGRDELLEVMPASREESYPGWDGLRTPRWHFVRWLTGRRELFDVLADPWERVNLVTTEPARAAMMEARLDELIVASGGPSPTVPDVAEPLIFEGCGYVRPSRPVVC
jgi:arylsulfatase A-like enzyme